MTTPSPRPSRPRRGVALCTCRTPAVAKSYAVELHRTHTHRAACPSGHRLRPHPHHVVHILHRVRHLRNVHQQPPPPERRHRPVEGRDRRLRPPLLLLPAVPLLLSPSRLCHHGESGAGGAGGQQACSARLRRSHPIRRCHRPSRLGDAPPLYGRVALVTNVATVLSIKKAHS